MAGIHVAHVVSTLVPGGAETFVLNLLRTLASHPRLRHSVFAVRPLEDRSFRQELEMFGSVEASGKIRGIGLGRSFRSFLDRYRPDGVFYHTNFVSPWLAVAGGRRARERSIFYFHGQSDRRYRDLRKRILFRASSLLFRTLRGQVWVCSEAARETLARLFWLDIRRAEVVYLGVDVERFRPPKDKAAARASLGWDRQGIAMGSVSNLTPVKNHALMIDAFAKAFQGGEAHLFIAGDGPTRAELASQIERLGLGGRVHLLGRRMDVPSVLAALDLFVLTSISEGLPLAVLEAMSAGVPVLAPRVGGLPEVVDDDCGRLFHSRDSDAVATEMRDLACVLPNAHMSAACRRRVEQQFDTRRFVEQYERLWLGETYEFA